MAKIKTNKRSTVSDKPYATFEFTTIDPNTTEQTKVEFFNGCDRRLSKPEWWVVTIVFVIATGGLDKDTPTIISEKTLVFSSPDKVLMKDFTVDINQIMVDSLPEGFRFISGRASCTIKDTKHVMLDVETEEDHDIQLIINMRKYCKED